MSVGDSIVELVIVDLRHIVGDKSVEDADRVAAANALFVWMRYRDERDEVGTKRKPICPPFAQPWNGETAKGGGL